LPLGRSYRITETRVKIGDGITKVNDLDFIFSDSIGVYVIHAYRDDDSSIIIQDFNWNDIINSIPNVVLKVDAPPGGSDEYYTLTSYWEDDEYLVFSLNSLGRSVEIEVNSDGSTYSV
jgi:hypothetical protein